MENSQLNTSLEEYSLNFVIGELSKRKNDIVGASPSEVESIVFCSLEKLKSIGLNSQLISGSSFPDIVCTVVASDYKFGIEVKSTQKPDFNFMGNSINESTRVSNVQSIFVVAVCVHKDYFDVRYDEYSKLIKDIKITHYPRYFLSFDNEKKSIFGEMNIDYSTFRLSEDKYNILRKHYRAKLKDGEELWWVDSENDVPVIKLWENESESNKEKIIFTSFILFPELVDPRSSRDKYKRVTSWLVARHALVSPNIRDLYSAGGKVEIEGLELPAVLGRLRESFSNSHRFDEINIEDIRYYWKENGLDIETAKNKFLVSIENSFASLSDTNSYDKLMSLFKKNLKK